MTYAELFANIIFIFHNPFLALIEEAINKHLSIDLKIKYSLIHLQVLLYYYNLSNKNSNETHSFFFFNLFFSSFEKSL